ncbi:MAG: hypothetical protein GYB67_05325 [Chloroflexi bacterium]|nr:hypothetical protein [Chloroflexota bacterium]
MTTYSAHDQRPSKPPRQPQPYAPDHGLNPWLIRLPILVLTGGILLGLLLTGGVAAYQIYYSDRIIPGVSAYGIDLSGLTPDEALAALETRFTFADEATFTFRDPASDRFWQYSAGDLGVSFEAQAAVAEAYTVGRTGSLAVDLIDQLLTWLNGHAVSPLIRYDQGAAAARLAAIAAEINRAPVDAALSFDGTTVSATQGSSGRSLDITATLNRLDLEILRLATGTEIPLAINETPPIALDTRAAASRAQTALSGPVMLMADDGAGTLLGPWMATVEQIEALLQITPVVNADGTRDYEVTLDVEPFRSYIASLAQGLIVPAANGRFHFDEATGQLVVIDAAVDGRTLNVDATLARLEQAIFSVDNRVVPLVFDYTRAPFHNDVTAAELGITGLISRGVSNYAGSTQARIQNIIQSAARFDGLIVAPGETFSFNEWVGDITPEEGYVSSTIIYGGRSIQGVGGGVCQVSTTAFRAAFYAGFPIVERHAHGYRVGYYERDSEGVGLDAAIYTPDLDMRFINDTDQHLLIETAVFPATSTVEFRFYGTSDGRQVIKDDVVVRDVVPPAATRYEVNNQLVSGQTLQVDWAAEGAYVEVWRVILDAAGNEIERQRFRSQYQPWGAIIQVPPGDPRVG